MTAKDGQVILVTGATGNLGAACIRAARDAGAKVAALARSEASLTRCFPDYRPDNNADPDFLAIAGADLGDPASAEACLEKTKAHFGRIDAVLNTVGGFAMKPLEEDSAQDWLRLHMLNVHSAVNITRAALPLLRENGGGSIIHVGALAGLEAGSGLSAYAASKASVLRMIEAVAKEVRADNIRINAVLPDTMDTPANRQAMPDADFSAWVSPSAVADAMVLLTRHAARAVTGALVPVTGRG